MDKIRGTRGYFTFERKDENFFLSSLLWTITIQWEPHQQRIRTLSLKGLCLPLGVASWTWGAIRRGPQSNKQTSWSCSSNEGFSPKRLGRTHTVVFPVLDKSLPFLATAVVVVVDCFSRWWRGERQRGMDSAKRVIWDFREPTYWFFNAPKVLLDDVKRPSKFGKVNFCPQNFAHIFCLPTWAWRNQEAGKMRGM